MTRHDPAEAGPSEQRGGCDQDTPETPVRGSVVYLVDPEFLAAEILDSLTLDGIPATSCKPWASAMTDQTSEELPMPTLPSSFMVSP